MLALSGISKTFIVLSHRDLLRRRWSANLQPTSHSTVIPNLVPFESRLRIGTKAHQFGDLEDDHILIIVQTVQAIARPDGNWSLCPWGPKNLDQVIRQRGDLVVVFDEAHHLRTSPAEHGWREALLRLHPKLLLGLTATPTGSRHELCSYTLRTLLQEGLFSKSLTFVVAVKPGATEDDAELEGLTVGLARLAGKQAQLQSLDLDHPLRERRWRPAMFVAAPSIEAANNAHRRLVHELGIDPARVLLITSKHASDRDLQKILELDQPTSRSTDIIVAAFMLDEGWDVTSVSVIVPLRALNSVGNAKQIIGRGLRLPLGRRTGLDELDQLDVVVVGQNSLAAIRAEIQEDFGSAAAVRPATLPKNPERLRTIPGEQPEARYSVLLERSGNLTDFKVPLVVPTAIVLPGSVPKVGATSHALIHASSGMIQHLAVESGEDAVGLDMRSLADLGGVLTEDELREFVISASPPGMQASLAGLKAALREYLQGAFYEWSASGISQNLLPEEVSSTSQQDPMNAEQACRGWRGNTFWYTGFVKSAYNLVRMDSEPEYSAAMMLDVSPEVEWWLRNDPHLFRISTPSGGFHPDFCVKTTHGRLVLLETKGEHLLKEHLASDIPTAEAWCASATAAGGFRFSVATVPGSDVDLGTIAALAAGEASATAQPSD
jgi:hypothetical protein